MLRGTNATRVPSMRRSRSSPSRRPQLHFFPRSPAPPGFISLIRVDKMSQPGLRQTKKQKKAFAFRTRQKTSKKNKDLDSDGDALGFPIDENQDLAGLADLPLEAEEVYADGRSGGRKGKAKDGDQHQVQSGGSKKRKREGAEVVEENSRKKSKAQSTVLESGVESDDGQKSAEAKEKVQPQRFILFIGAFGPCSASETKLTHCDCREPEVFYDKGCYSLPFLLLRYGRFATRALHHRSHISLDPPPTVRLPTPKTAQPPSRSKGYAFLEFTDKKALQQALRLHHSELEGRKINVELTAGGGGKSEHRVKKLQDRNKGLHEQRVPQFRIPFFLSLTVLRLSEASNSEAQTCCEG